MALVLLKRCTRCKEYTLQETCPRCGAAAKPNRPAKYSPEDPYGAYRRKLKKLDAAKGPGKSDSERVAGAQPPRPSVPATQSTESKEAGLAAKGPPDATKGAPDPAGSVARRAPKPKGA